MAQGTEQNTARKERPLAFWDIESLSNIFMFAVYHPDTEIGRDLLMFYYLMDDIAMTDALKDIITKRVFKENRHLDPAKTDILYLDLKDEKINVALANLFCVDNKPAFGRPSQNQFSAIVPVLHTDLEDDMSFPYMLGYNSANYDNTMMAFYFNEVFGFSPSGKATFMPTTAKFMRQFNNLLFGQFKDRMPDALKGLESNIYQNTMRSGLFLDAAKVNDKVYKMPLKRIMGMLGMDIFEDDVVKGNAPVAGADDIAKLFAYNASDCVKLSVLFEHRAYKAQFQLKKGLIDTYQDLIYNKDGEVRINRLKVDDTSAKFAARVLCPDGFLPDIRTVSFEYPKNSGRNILKETREWAEGKFGKDSEVMVRYLGPVFDYYAAIEGKNYDDSDHYLQTYPTDGLPASNIRSIPHPCTCVPYFNKDGSFSRTYVNFGIGGIHGAEYNQDLYLADMAEYDRRLKAVKDFVSHFTDDELKALKAKVVIDGVEYKTSDYITKCKDKSIKVKVPKPVELFRMDKKSGNWALNKRYVYCSDDEVDHEDFTSYYPCMLMNMEAFRNEMLGEDRYVQQFNNKTEFGGIMKDKSRPKSERDFYSTMREGTKLILNSASGAADTAYDTNIRMNNVIISMRIIGQLFTWRIGQAQTLEGFKITSTNTDGLYAVCDDSNRALCRSILEREAKSIGVGIEPEAMRLISKDANNRVEVELDGKIAGASGGDAACWEGPVPTKALSHPAIVDALLVHYLVKYGVNEPFDEMRGMGILDRLKSEKSPLEMLMLYQQIINSSEGSCRYIFGVVDGDVRTFQHNNRIFAVKSEAAHLYIANGTNKNVKEKLHDATADGVLSKYGENPDEYMLTRIVKIPRIPPEQNMFIYNKALDELPEQTMRGLIDNIDDGFYIDLLRNAYANWCNAGSHEDGEDDGLEEAV